MPAIWCKLFAMSAGARDKDSRLLNKLRGLQLELPLDLERLAIARGCDYYERDLGPRMPPLEPVPLSNAELAIALIVPALQPAAREIRLAAALIGAPGVIPEEAAALAIEENCAGIVRYIASCGNRFEPQNPFWQALLGRLPDTKVDADTLPHPSRFVEMTGIDRGKVGTFTRWIRTSAHAAS